MTIRTTIARILTIAVLGVLLIISLATPVFADTLLAGFSRMDITPPVGTPMTGFGAHYHDTRGARAIHDPVEARGIFLKDGTEAVLIVGIDVLFLSRDEADRFRGAIGRHVDLKPSQILLNTSHNHTGPRTGTWFYLPTDRYYLDFLENALVQLATEAIATMQEVTLWAGETITDLAVSRRLPNPETGEIDFAPNPEGLIYPYVPFVLFKDVQERPVFLIFSVAAHPSNIKGVERSFHISADYPGVARRRLDQYLGRVGSLFLQGGAGCTKCTVVESRDRFPSGTWEEVEQAGAKVAETVIKGIEKQLVLIAPKIRIKSIEMQWPMQELVGRKGYEEVLRNPSTHSESMPEVKARWAEDMLSRLDRGFTLPTRVPITAHGVQLGTGLRIVAIEGEMVAALSHQIRKGYPSGITLPLGYSNGCQLYLPTSEMLDEGGYEVESYWEYRHPAPLARGMEAILDDALKELRTKGIN